MKKIFVLSMLCFIAVSASAKNIGNDFRDRFNILSSGSLSAYNRDIGTMIGIADFHTGSGTSFPGFDVGAQVAAVKPGDGNNLSSSDYIYVPYITAETKLPIWDLTVMARGTTYDGFDSLGGGVKKTINIAALIDVSGIIFYDRYGTDYYQGNHYSASATASASLLIFTPYIGIGYDYSDMKVKDIPGFSGQKTNDDMVRYTAGVNVHPFPFVYLFGAYTWTKDTHALQGGLGVHF